MFYYCLSCKPCLSRPFDPVGNGRLTRLTTFFGQIFFFAREILLTSRPNYTVLTPVPKTGSLGAIFLIESFILPTLNKVLQKSRLTSVASGCIRNGLQLDGLNVAIISVEGMPLSSLRLLPRKTNSEIMGARASAALQLLSAYVTTDPPAAEGLLGSLRRARLSYHVTTRLMVCAFCASYCVSSRAFCTGQPFSAALCSP